MIVVIRHPILALFLLLTAAHASAQTGANDTQVEQAKTLITDQRFVEALAAAKDATRLDLTDHRARYYVAMAYMGMRQYDSAASEAAVALTLAPDSAKPAVQKLIDTIGTLRSGTGSVAGAEAALSDGLIGKAARLYEEAWSAGRNAPDFAFKAADLYAERLNQPVDAARLLRQVQQFMPGSAAADRADVALKTLAPKLREIASAQVAAARRSGSSAGLTMLQAAEDADPSFADIYRLRAQIAGTSGSTELVQAAIKDLARRNLISVDELLAMPNLSTLLQQPDFAQFVADVIGAEQANALKVAISPAGQVAFLSRIAGQDSLQLFVGSNSVGQGSYRTYSRRKITAVQAGPTACQTTIMLGDTVEISSNITAGLAGRVLDWRRSTGPTPDGSYVALGPVFDGWEAIGLNVGAAVPAARVAEAIRVIRAACPLPAKKGR